jgi:hypothetical protein
MTYQSERKQFLAPSIAPPVEQEWYNSLPPGRLAGKPLTAEKTPRWELDLDAALDAEDRDEMARARTEDALAPAVFTPAPAKTKLTEDVVRHIHRFAARGVYPSEIAKLCGVSTSVINNVLSGRTWKNVAVPTDPGGPVVAHRAPDDNYGFGEAHDQRGAVEVRKQEAAEYLAFRRDPAVYLGAR